MTAVIMSASVSVEVNVDITHSHTDNMLYYGARTVKVQPGHCVSLTVLLLQSGPQRGHRHSSKKLTPRPSITAGGVPKAPSSVSH